jgi:magnesium transporter
LDTGGNNNVLATAALGTAMCSVSLRRIMTQQRDILGQLTRGEVPLMGQMSRIYFRDVLDHLNREIETIDIYRDLLMGCRDIYMSSINNRLNRIMKTLAIISVVTFGVPTVRE